MNLFRKIVASITLAALVVSTSATGVSAYSNDELTAANGLAAAGVINDNAANPAGYNFAGTLTRAEAAKVAANLAKVSPKTTCENKFADITATTPNNWVCGYAEALLDAGKISANTNFNPSSSLTKAEATKMMLEAAGHTDVYNDASNWQAETVAYAAENNIVSAFTDYNTPAVRGFVFGTSYHSMNNVPSEYECDENFSSLGICDEPKETVKKETVRKETVRKNTVFSNKGASVELSPETPVDGTIAADSPRTVLLAVDVTAGNEDLTLKEADLKYTGVTGEEAITKLAIYLDNEKVTKGDTKEFDNENEETLKFDKEVVITAGQTKTLFITATVTNKDNENASHQITLVNLKTRGGDLSSNPIA
jgi:hypothetical protein